jgi:hypothetical protein
MNWDDILDVFSFMAVAARGCVIEPRLYGPLRLVDSMSRWFYLLKKNDLVADDRLEAIVELIDRLKYTCMTDEEAFIGMLDDVVDGLVDLQRSKK